MMRKILSVTIAVTVLGLGLVGPAHADTASVSGSGDIDRMTVKNGDSAVVVKIFGPGGKCEVRSVSATLKGTDGVSYQAQGGCYPGNTWALSLSKGTRSIACSEDRLRYNADNEFWKFVVPRSCLTKLTNKIKVTGSLVYGPTPGEAGPTRLIPRG